VSGAALRWARGGEARVVSIAGDAIVLRSTVPWPPGARVEGVLEGEPPATLRIKVHACKRQPSGGAGAPPTNLSDGAGAPTDNVTADFVIDGRTLDMTRETRQRLGA
jgi:hypothetical protein